MGSERTGFARWPGLDGAALTLLALVLVGVYLGRGGLGGEVRVAVVVGLDLLWLGASWLARRPGAEEES